MVKKQTISVDYDGTFSASPDLFRSLMATMQRDGHTVLMITHRCERHRKELEAAVQLPIEIIFASGMTKVQAAFRSGYHVDLWLDDEPWAVTMTRRCGCGGVL